MKKVTPRTIRSFKGVQKFACLTAYDAQTSHLFEEAEIPLILVGDSVGTTHMGFESTIPVTLDDMVHHTAAVVRGNAASLIVADMPFMTYATEEQAMASAARLMQEGGCDAVKLEGGLTKAAHIRAIVENGIPVCGHIGLTPQSEKAIGLRVQGRDEEAAKRLLADAKAVEEAGAFAIVLEAMPAALAEEITRALAIPTIGIGAGAATDGQILVYTDMLGLGGAFCPKFAKRYADVGQIVRDAARSYAAEVAGGAFPAAEHTYL
jgi:3-methyl-2-oxobutanoate hydroxymethyltransferase